MLAGLYFEDHHDMAWIDDVDFVPHLWATLKRPRIKIFITQWSMFQALKSGGVGANFLGCYRSE